MNKICTLIVDDEPHAIRRIERILANHPEFFVAGSCLNAAVASAQLKGGGVDLLFLDIEMPGESGIRFVSTLPEQGRPEVVFVTSFDDYAVMAFEYFALDYVLKPFSNDRFLKTLQRVKDRFTGKGSRIDWQRVSSFMENREHPMDRFVIKTGSKYEFLPYDKVNYILANGTYATLVCVDGRKLLHRETIGNLSDMLEPHGFKRVHHSSIVRVANIRGINRLSFGDIEIVMNDGMSVRVSRRYKAAVKQHLL